MPPSSSPEEASLVRRTPQQYSLEQALRPPLKTARMRGELSSNLGCERRGTHCSHFGVSGMQFVLCIILLAHASALGRARTGVVGLLKNPFTSAGGVVSSTVGAQEPPLTPSTKSQDFLYDTDQLLLSERGLPLIIENKPRW